MLGFYLGSVGVWFIILRSSACICKDRIVKNGHISEGAKRTRIVTLGTTIAVCAIPIFRVLVFVIIFLMAALPKKEFDEFIGRNNEGDE